MAIEITPHGVGKPKTIREFGSPLVSFTAAGAAFLLTALVVWMLTWALAEKNKKETAQFEKDRVEIEARRDPKLEAELREHLARLSALDERVRSHKNGEQVFLFLEKVIQPTSRVRSLQVDVSQGSLQLEVESFDFVEAARQIAAFEDDARVRTVQADTFSRKAEAGGEASVTFQASLEVSESVFLAN